MTRRRPGGPLPGEPLLPPPPDPLPFRRLRLRWRRAAALRRRIRATRLGWVFLGSGLAVALAALNTGNNLLYLVFATQLSMITLSGVLSELAIQQLRIERRLPVALFAGVPATGEWRLTNARRWLAHFALSVEEAATPHAPSGRTGCAQVAVLPPGATLRVAADFCLPNRGIHRLVGARVSTTWPFGIFEKHYVVPLPDDALVYPRPLRAGLPEAPADSAGGLEVAAGRQGAGEFLALRDHRDGDDLRLIHWRSSARRQRLVAVERADASAPRCVVQLPAPEGHGAERGTRFEEAVRRATGEVLAGGEAGAAVELLLPTGVRLSSTRGDAPSATRVEALAPLLRALALASAQAGPS